MANNYWNNKHEHLVKCWASADTRQQYSIYNKLHPAVYQMASSILYRYYYSFDVNKIYEAIAHLYCNMHNYKSDKGKAYSFCQTVIKNYLHTILAPTKYETKRSVDLEYSDMLEDISYNQFIDEEDKPYLKKFNELYIAKEELAFKLKTYDCDSKSSGVMLSRLISEYIILSNIIIFLNEFNYMDRNPAAIVENVAIMSNRKESMVKDYTKKYLNISTNPNYFRVTKTDKKYAKLGILDDDYPPSTEEHEIQIRRNKLMKTKTFQTF